MDSSTIYTPLNKEREQIRILLLLPGAFDDPLRCDLSIKSTKARFEALSYVWGDATSTLSIEVRAQEMQVTKNLEDALRHIRSQNEIRRLWVDAVCINQKDDLERNHQVGMMDAIYGRAERVVVWLGQEEQTELQALQAIQHFGTNPDLHWDPAKGKSTEKSVEAPTLQLLIWLQKTWYTRIWTLQEAALAKSLTYICGSFIFENGEIDGVVKSFLCHFSIDSCCDMMNIEGKYGIGNMDVELAIPLRRLANVTRLQNKRSRSKFLDIASMFRYRQATDPRDKVFGVLGLIDDLPKDIIDYAKSVPEIYSSATIEYIKKSGNLDVLSHVMPKSQNAPYHNPPESRKDLPSWVPDWSDHRPFESWRLYGYSERQLLTKLFNACHQNSQASPECPSPMCLRLQGFICDQITEFGPAMIFKYKSVQVDVFHNWRKMVNIDKEPEKPYISGSTIFDAYWRTLCMNTDFITNSSDLPKKADGDTRALHDSWWWEVLLHDKYKDVPGQTRKYYEHNIRLFGCGVGLLTSGRKLFFSKKGYLGFAPEDAREGDEIWVLNGGRVPLILRPSDKNSEKDSQPEYIFVGDSYVHGIMDGEFVDASTKKGEMPRPVVLI